MRESYDIYARRYAVWQSAGFLSVCADGVCKLPLGFKSVNVQVVIISCNIVVYLLTYSMEQSPS